MRPSSLAVRILAVAALVMTVLVFVPITSQAFTVEVDGTGTSATAIRNLDVEATFYDVEFLFGRGNNIYGFPPELDFTTLLARDAGVRITD